MRSGGSRRRTSAVQPGPRPFGHRRPVKRLFEPVEEGDDSASLAIQRLGDRRDPKGETWRFDALDTDRFGYGNLTVSFRRHDGRIDGAALDIGRARGMVCSRA